MLTCGVEINQQSLKWVVLEGRRKSCIPVGHGRIALTAGQSAAEVLGQVRDSGKIPSRVRIASGLEMSQLRTLLLPPMPRREMHQAIQHEIETEQELVDEAMATGYQALGRSPEGKHRILVAQTPRQSIESLEAALSRESFEVETLTTSSVALLSYGLSQLEVSEQEQAIAVVHIGEQRMLLTVLERGRIRLIRDLGLGLDATLFGTLELEATGTTGTVSLSDDFDPLEELSRGLSEVQQVAGQIRRTLDHDKQNSAGPPLTRVLLAGDATRARALGPLIANELSLPIDLLDPADALGMEDDSEFGGEGPSYALPFALARLRDPGTCIHFGQKPRASSPSRLLPAAVAALALGVALTVASFPLGANVSRLEESKNDLKAEIVQLRQEIGAASGGEGLADHPGALRSLLANSSPDAVLSWTSRCIPEGESLESLSLVRSGADWEVSMSGVFQRPEHGPRISDWSALLQRLEQEPRVHSLSVPASSGSSARPTTPVAIQFTWSREP